MAHRGGDSRAEDPDLSWLPRAARQHGGESDRLDSHARRGEVLMDRNRHVQQGWAIPKRSLRGHRGADSAAALAKASRSVYLLCQVVYMTPWTPGMFLAAASQSRICAGAW